MNQIFIFLVLGCMVTTGGLATECKRCWNLDSTQCCTEKQIQCEGSKCMMLSEYCNVSNVLYLTVKKTCGFEPICNNCFSASTVNDFFLRVSAECGEGDNSNANFTFKKLCPDPLPPNGLQCPSCYLNTTTDGCKSTKMVSCGGNEKECVTFRSLVEMSDGTIIPMSMKGCITQGGCQLGFGYIPGAKQLNCIEMTCTPAKPIPCND